VPPLRERREDIPELIDTLFQRAKERHGLLDVRMASAVHQRLISYRWPGNVRQLENVLERLLVLSSGDLITIEDLPEELVPASPSTAILWPNLPEDGISLEAIERELISRALEKFDGNQTQAARYLDISRRTLIYRMEKHGLAAVDSEIAENPT
jgi:two-component system NtrC family response regulator